MKIYNYNVMGWYKLKIDCKFEKNVCRVVHKNEKN